MSLDTLPEELLLRVFKSLDQLRDLYAVTLVSKQFNRISEDVKLSKLSQLALSPSKDFPALQPIEHFVLYASARHLSEWARRAERRQRQKRLENAIYRGVAELAALALEVAPINLADIRGVWAWKRDVLKPLSEDLEAKCNQKHGRHRWSETHGMALALFAWTVYGELFDHFTAVGQREPTTKKLKSIIRFKFLVYCVPDLSCFRKKGAVPPPWLRRPDINATINTQQRNLRRAIDIRLNLCTFGDAIRQLIDMSIGPVGEYFPGAYGCFGIQRIFFHIVMNSGRRSLEILQMARLVKSGQNPNTAVLTAWLRDSWEIVVRTTFRNQDGYGHVYDPARPPRGRKDWFDRHIASVVNDLKFTIELLEDDSVYHLRADELRAAGWPEKEIETSCAEYLKLRKSFQAWN